MELLQLRYFLQLASIQHVSRAAEKLHFTAGDDIYLLYGTDSLALAYKVYDHLKTLAVQRAGKEAE